MRADGEVARVGRHALHHGDVHVEVRRLVRGHGPQRHLARRVRQVQHLGVDLLLAQDRNEGVAGERRLDREARRLAHAVVRLVRHHRHLARVGERRAHHVVAPVAQVEVQGERGGRIGILDRQHVVAGLVQRHLEDGVLVGGGLDDDVGRHEHVHAVAVPRLPAVRLLAVRVHRIDALDLRRQRARLGEAGAVGGDARHRHARTDSLLELHAARRRRADVERVEVLHGALPRRRGTAAVLKDGSLRRRAHGRLRETVVRPDRRHVAERTIGVQALPIQRPEVGLEAQVLVAEAPALPFRGGERHVLEHDRALAGEALGGSAEEVFRLDREGEIRGIKGGCRVHGHADLRRGELLDLDGHAAEEATVLSGDFRQNRPVAARLVVGHGETVVGDRAFAVGGLRHGRVGVAVGVDEPESHRHLRRRAARAGAGDDVHEDLLAVAVDAAVGPAEGGRLLFAEERVARAVGVRFVHHHRVAEREKGRVVARSRPHHDGERLALVNARGAAPALGVGDALHDLGVGLGVDLHLRAAHGRALHEGRHPHAQAVLSARAHAETEVGETDEAEMARVVVVIPPIVVPRLVGVEDAHEEHAVRGLAVVHLEREEGELLLVEAVGARELPLLAGAGEFGGLLVVHVALPLVPGVGALLARQELHDVPRLHAHDVRVDLPHVHGLQLQKPLAAGG